MTDRYAVIGNPVAHSRSPEIHMAFARETSQDIEYQRVLAPPEGFAAEVRAFRAQGARGANVTVPFKQEAACLVDVLSGRARAAGAVNTLKFDAQGMFGDNTDGVGLVLDLTKNLGRAIAGKRVLLVGAGGAARGVVSPLLSQKPAVLVVANRTEARARELVSHFVAHYAAHFAGVSCELLTACSFSCLANRRFDLVINATSASLAGNAPSLPRGLYADGALAYDMMYAKGDTAFMDVARREGASVADGLGMLVEQAAESFFLWRGIRPATRPVLEALRRVI